jgi:hypothetical protein
MMPCDWAQIMLLTHSPVWRNVFSGQLVTSHDLESAFDTLFDPSHAQEMQDTHCRHTAALAKANPKRV